MQAVIMSPRARLPALLLTSMIAGCALAPCGLSGCPGDAEITAQVQQRLAQEPALRAPNQVNVQTVHGVVYLTGLVDTPFQRQMAQSIAGQVPGVAKVNSSIGLAGNSL